MRNYSYFLLALTLSAVLFGCSALTGVGDLTPLDPSSSQAKIVVKSQIGLLRPVSLKFERINSRADLEDSYTVIVSPGITAISLDIFDGSGPQTSTILYVEAEAGHTYILVPATVGLNGPLGIMVEDHFRDTVVSRTN